MEYLYGIRKFKHFKLLAENTELAKLIRLRTSTVRVIDKAK